MKKALLLILITLFMAGCTPLEKKSFDEIIDTSVNEKLELYNQYRSGYKYYLPKGMVLRESGFFNEKLTSSIGAFYLYIDAVSYYNHVISDYEVKENTYYSKAINHQDKFGYIEIKNIKADKYLVEIMYNYAKIEVIVDEMNIKSAVYNSINILSSIKFNDKIIANLMGDDISLFSESEYNIFETKTTESTYLYYIENNQYEEEVHDPDLID